MSHSRALVFGGTGYIGGEVLRGLARARIATAFTYFKSQERATALAAELDQQATQLDLRDTSALRRLIAELVDSGFVPDVVIHCAAVAEPKRLAMIDERAWHETLAVNVGSAFFACQALASHFDAEAETNIVLTAGVDAVQLVDTPAHFGTSQAALAGLVRALAKELGPTGVRINLVTFGPMGGGVSACLDPSRAARFRRYSALGRLGTASEAARAILWVALENKYMNGAVVAVSGGI